MDTRRPGPARVWGVRVHMQLLATVALMRERNARAKHTMMAHKAEEFWSAGFACAAAVAAAACMAVIIIVIAGAAALSF